MAEADAPNVRQRRKLSWNSRANGTSGGGGGGGLTRVSESESGTFHPSATNDDSYVSALQSRDDSPIKHRHHSAVSRSHEPVEVPYGVQGLWAFLTSELTRGYDPGNAEDRYSEKRKKVYAFIKIPRELEKFLFYGLMQCIDAFLYIFTFLPIRFLLAIFHVVTRPCRSKPVTSAEICDVLKVFVLVVASIIIAFVDTSAMYHVVRGQAVIKLYIFYNMLEVADKLFSSFGQDILDALFWTATERRVRKREHLGTLAHVAMAIAYVVMHTMLVLLQATTLNVAFNSQNKALMTIMMSNNFVELKGSVFKKFAKNNLFQMSCSDVRERFHYLILLTVVVVRNMGEFNWKWDHFWEMTPDLALVIFGEFAVDWVKHAFITKFNEIPYEVYKDFTITIAYDAANSRRSGAFSDHSDQVSRRMGFIPLPLSVLLIRVMPQSIKMTSSAALIIMLVCYFVLISLKVLNSIIVMGWANDYIKDYENYQRHAETLKRIHNQRRAKSLPGSPRLSLIEFTDVMSQQHPRQQGLTLSDVLPHVYNGQLQFHLRGNSGSEDSSTAATSKESSSVPSPRDPPSSTMTNSPSSSSLPKLPRSKSVVQIPKLKLSGLNGSDQSQEKDVMESGGGDVGSLMDSSGSGVPSGAKVSGGVVATSLDKPGECESLAEVDRFTLCNDDRIVM